jgi:hypothetical protein
MWSNERRHDLYFPLVDGLGGGYVGVGGDQNYTMAAAAQSQVLWLIDLDAAVVRMHRLYAALLAAAATPAEFVALFDARHHQAVVDAVAAYHQALPEDERRAVLAVYQIYREDLHQHLQSTAAYRWGGRAVTWLGEPTLYNHMRKLAQARLIVPRLGDLTGPSTVVRIAAVARAAGVPIHILYLSNAESWFRYGREFRRNITALPFDDRAVVLRTVKSQVLTYPHGDIWHYSVQRADHFARRLDDREYTSIDVAMVDAEPWSGPPPTDEAAAAAAARPRPLRGISRIGFPAQGAPPPPTAGRKQAEKERARRQELLAAGLVTRPEGNREKASQMDRDREKRAADLAAASTPTPAPPPSN